MLKSGICQSFSAWGQVVNILGFVAYTISFITIELCYCSVEATIKKSVKK